MNVPDLARRAAISDQQKAQAKAADAGLRLKMAADCFTREFFPYNSEEHSQEVAEKHYANLAAMSFKAADAFMAEYKKRREENAPCK